GGQLNGFVPDRDLRKHRIEREIPEADLRALPLRQRFAAQTGLNSRDQFVLVKGFAEIIIRTEVESFHAAGDIRRSGNKDNGNISGRRGGPELTAGFIAVDVFQGKIKEDDIRFLGKGHLKGRGPISGTNGLETGSV